MLPRMNGGKAPMAIYSGFTGNHAILAIGTARARQPRALDLNGGLSLNLPLAIGLLYDRTWSAAAGYPAEKIMVVADARAAIPRPKSNHRYRPYVHI